MKPVLVLENQYPEKVGYLGTWLTDHKIPYKVYNAEIHKEFPSSIDDYSGLAIMGGAMSVNDRIETHRQAEILILQAMYRDIPVIGHCLGGQLMAKALGAKVVASPLPEIGWQDIEYVDSFDAKNWFGENPTKKVMHWHYESFELPTYARLVATNSSCPNQAFTIDGKHLAMQFHIEMDGEKLSYWTSEDDEKWAQGRAKYNTIHEATELIGGAEKYLSDHQRTANNIYKKWLSFLF